MRCDCERCRGDGEIRCPDCGGTGQAETSILNYRPDWLNDNLDAFNELKDDALRVQSQAEHLIATRPDHAPSYRAQLQATLERIEREAERVLENK